MAVEGIGSVLDTSASTRRAGLQQEDFLKVLLTQLSYQDPLKPMDNQEYIAQLAQFSGLEQTRQVNERIADLLSLQSVDQALVLLGKQVEVTTSTGAVVGQVTTASFEGGVPNLTVQASNGTFLTNVSLSQVRVVR